MSATLRYGAAVLSLCLVVSTPATADIFGKIKGLFGEDTSGTVASLTESDIAEGLKEALRVGTETVVARLGRVDGFNGDPKIRIPLPASLNKANAKLSKFGFGGYGDVLEEKLNRAAEVATPRAKALFLHTISEMTLDDARRIYAGPDDAATRYFQDKMSPALAAEMTPIVDQSLAEVGAITAYDEFVGKYQGLPFVPDVRADLSGYVVGKAMDGIFHYVAEEEAAIRADPAKRTTDILKTVFGK